MASETQTDFSKNFSSRGKDASTMRGYVQVYTGNGKGKTTAALGLALRAAGAGLKVFIVQFIKRGEYSEIKALRRFSDLIQVEQFGLGRFLEGQPSAEDIEAAQKGVARIHEIMAEGRYQVIILDEANVAVKSGLIPVQKLLGLIVAKPYPVEMIITGRYASTRIMEAADLVTEMKVIKHYYHEGIEARVGIEK